MHITEPYCFLLFSILLSGRFLNPHWICWKQCDTYKKTITETQTHSHTLELRDCCSSILSSLFCCSRLWVSGTSSEISVRTALGTQKTKQKKHSFMYRGVFALCVCVWLLLTGTALGCSPQRPRVSVCPRRLCCSYSPSKLHPVKYPGLRRAGNWDVGGLSSPLESTLASHFHRERLPELSHNFMFSPINNHTTTFVGMEIHI